MDSGQDGEGLTAQVVATWGVGAHEVAGKQGADSLKLTFSTSICVSSSQTGTVVVGYCHKDPRRALFLAVPQLSLLSSSSVGMEQARRSAEASAAPCDSG